MLYLIGQAACGKSTLGAALAACTGRPWVDLDAEIERRAGMSVRQIFDTLGEEEFRRIEADTLALVAARADSPIVACGGGTPCRDASMRLMLATGTVVWLRADPARVISRILDAPGQRPRYDHVRDLAEALRRELDDRTPAYARAHHTFDSTRLDTADEIADTVTRFITQIPF